MLRWHIFLFSIFTRRRSVFIYFFFFLFFLRGKEKEKPFEQKIPIIMVESNALCYFVNGDIAFGAIPCFPTLTNSPCCWHNLDCLANGLCINPQTNGTLRGTCTDDSWKSAFCPQYCRISSYRYSLRRGFMFFFLGGRKRSRNLLITVELQMNFRGGTRKISPLIDRRRYGNVRTIHLRKEAWCAATSSTRIHCTKQRVAVLAMTQSTYYFSPRTLAFLYPVSPHHYHHHLLLLLHYS